MSEVERRERQIARERDELGRKSVRHRRGVVTGLDPLEVTLGGSDVPYLDVRALDSATLAIDDVVSCLLWQGDLLVLGTLGGSTGWLELNLGPNTVVISGEASYRRDGKIVRLRGWVARPSSGDLVAELPSGFRPEQRARFSVIQEGSNPQHARIDVQSNGDVTVDTDDNGQDISLDQIVFVAE